MRKLTITEIINSAIYIISILTVLYDLGDFCWAYPIFEETQKTIYTIHITLPDGRRPSTVAVESFTGFWVFLTLVIAYTIIYLKKKELDPYKTITMFLTAVTITYSRRGIHENLYGLSHSIKFNSWLPFYVWVSVVAYVFLFYSLFSFYNNSFNISCKKLSLSLFIGVCVIGIIYGITMVVYMPYYVGDLSTPWVNNPLVHNRYLVDLKTNIWIGGEHLTLKLYINEIIMILWFVAFGFFIIMLKSLQGRANLIDFFVLSVVVVTAVAISVGLRVNHQWRLFDAAKGFHTEWGSLKTAAVCFTAVYFSFLITSVSYIIHELYSKKHV